LKLENKALKKKINNKRQSELSKEKRKKNVIDAYEITNSEKIKNKRIVLFDDIYTTGSTVNEISRILKENGAKKILVITIAKD
jgi:predicted amidophosphoribosyltransferase